MIPVTLSRVKTRREATTFQCFHCNGLFRVRHRGKKFCVECTILAENARSLAHKRLYREIKAGKIKPPTDFNCADCGAPADRYDHRDYSKPYDVEPVCCRCNLHRGPAVL